MATSSVLAEKRRRALAPTAKWVKPVDAAPGTQFGVKGPLWASGYHTGEDFPAPVGTTVKAVAAGRVSSAGLAGAYGNRVVIVHAPGFETWYCHLSAFAVRAGAQVAAGQKIGEVGATGNVTGPHLHLEVRVNGVAKDPAPYLSGAADAPSSPDYDSGAQPADTTTNTALIRSASTSSSSDGGLAVEVRRVAIVLTAVLGGVALVAVGVAKGTEPLRRTP